MSLGGDAGWLVEASTTVCVIVSPGTDGVGVASEVGVLLSVGVAVADGAGVAEGRGVLVGNGVFVETGRLVGPYVAADV